MGKLVNAASRIENRVDLFGWEKFSLICLVIGLVLLLVVSWIFFYTRDNHKEELDNLRRLKERNEQVINDLHQRDEAMQDSILILRAENETLQSRRQQIDLHIAPIQQRVDRLLETPQDSEITDEELLQDLNTLTRDRFNHR